MACRTHLWASRYLPAHRQSSAAVEMTILDSCKLSTRKGLRQQQQHVYPLTAACIPPNSSSKISSSGAAGGKGHWLCSSKQFACRCFFILCVHQVFAVRGGEMRSRSAPSSEQLCSMPCKAPDNKYNKIMKVFHRCQPYHNSYHKTPTVNMTTYVLIACAGRCLNMQSKCAEQSAQQQSCWIMTGPASVKCRAKQKMQVKES